ncbi:MAG TPA: hypothetical protein V6C72_19170 [Chroococcales cyanobacterium]
MQQRERILIAMLPFLAAGALAYTLVKPALEEDQKQADALKDQKMQLDQLQNKVKQIGKAQSEQRHLESDIDSLRGSVPKSPELDLLIIDLEKMCSQCGVGLVAVEQPSADVMHQLDISKDELNDVAATAEQGKLSLGSKSLPAKNNSQLKANEKAAVEQSPLKKAITQVFVTGEYAGLVDLMRKLESYERVIGIRNIAVAVPTQSLNVDQNPASDRAQRLKLKQPLMSFIMTLYYLP